MENLSIIISFLIFLGLFIVIGLASKLKAQETSMDYLLASHSIKPWLVSLSAVATNNSGYMFIGMIGYTYTVGIALMWLAIGWIIGDFIASSFIHRSIRVNTVSHHVLSYPSLIAAWQGHIKPMVRRLAALITVIFLGSYAAAQLNAGSKALHVLFDWHYSVGSILGAGIVVVYCYAGGIRASIWTDVAQSFVMVLAMAMMCILSFMHIGSFAEVMTDLNEISPTYFQLFSNDLMFGPWIGPILFVIGWLFAGFGVVGQPHIMVRFMSMEKPNQIQRVRFYYYSWYILFFALTIFAGICARLLIKDTNFDAELALPLLAIKLFPGPIVGLVLAGLFAATMSTADSQILSCAASITKDFVKMKDAYWVNKLATIGVTLLALIIALSGSKSVFALVVFSWSVLGASFAPILTLLALKKTISSNVMILMMLSGLCTVLIWSQFEIANTMYSIAPGILIGFIVYGLSTLSTSSASQEQASRG